MKAFLVSRAAIYAFWKHRRQKRKYTFELYWFHCHEVAQLVKQAGGTKEQIAASYLHDVVEDCGVTFAQLTKKFGPRVAALVSMVTEVSKKEDGNRKVRKAIDLAHYAAAEPEGKMIKLADMISNSSSILKYDKHFSKIYIPEKKAILDVIPREVSPKLYDLANNMLLNYLLDQAKKQEA